MVEANQWYTQYTYPSPRDPIYYHKQMTQRKKLKEESIEEYVYSQVALGKRAEFSESVIVKYVIAGLGEFGTKSPVRLAGRIDTIEELIAQLKWIEGVHEAEECAPKYESMFTITTADEKAEIEEKDVNAEGPKKEIVELVNQYRGCFATNMKELGVAKNAEMKIMLTDKEPMRKYIRAYAQACPQCALQKSKVGKPEGYLHPLPKEPVPFKIVHIDHMGPFVSDLTAECPMDILRLIKQLNFIYYSTSKRRCRKTAYIINNTDCMEWFIETMRCKMIKEGCLPNPLKYIKENYQQPSILYLNPISTAGSR
ncbi:hypothetical protein AND_000203 [Anopheles darlingi]|uniref:Uncharacterized protein n=1 Tax=Anopheles darlingi TaxID=43151 RepID=W5JV06_ANODA|nr:hypothetical protein AND_000203 [Anopheles darlingi]